MAAKKIKHFIGFKPLKPVKKIALPTDESEFEAEERCACGMRYHHTGKCYKRPKIDSNSEFSVISFILGVSIANLIWVILSL